MTYQQLWCCVHWPTKGFSPEEAKDKFDAYWNGHDNEREMRDHWRTALDVIRAVINEEPKL